MKKTGKAKIAFQTGKRAFYGEVEIELTPVVQEFLKVGPAVNIPLITYPKVLFPDDFSVRNHPWKKAFEFGVAYVWTHYWDKARDWNVKFSHVKDFPVDSSEISMAMATMRAYTRALGIEVEKDIVDVFMSLLGTDRNANN